MLCRQSLEVGRHSWRRSGFKQYLCDETLGYRFKECIRSLYSEQRLDGHLERWMMKDLCRRRVSAPEMCGFARQLQQMRFFSAGLRKQADFREGRDYYRLKNVYYRIITNWLKVLGGSLSRDSEVKERAIKDQGRGSSVISPLSSSLHPPLTSTSSHTY